MNYIGLSKRSVPFVASVAALLLLGLGLKLLGRSPWSVYSGLFAGSLGSRFAIAETLVATIPIIFCALATAVPRWAGLISVGAEGALYAGAVGATYAALQFSHWPSVALVPSMLLLAACAGAVWAAVPALLRVFLGINETIVTLLGNYVAVLLVEYLVHGVWQDPASYSWPQSAAFVASAELPRWPGTRVHLGLAVAILAALLLWVLRSRTVLGLRLEITGSNPTAANYAGYPVRKYQLLVMVVGGILAAMAGWGQVAAIEGRLRSALSPGYGYSGFLVAWMARHHPLGILGFSLLLAAMLTGSDNLQLRQQLPAAMVNIFQGILLFCLLGAEYIADRQTTKMQVAHRGHEEEVPQ